MTAKTCPRGTKKVGGECVPAKPKIERSTGIPITVGGIPYLVGSGYEGKTKHLDDIVQNGAKILTNYFNRDIEIRFNSDQRSGGAWIKDNMDNTQVGLNASLFNENKIYHETYVQIHTLKPHVLKNYPKDDSTRKYWRYKDALTVIHPNQKVAFDWIKKNIDMSKVKQ